MFWQCVQNIKICCQFTRDPTESELNDPNVVVIDIGERHEPHLSNFDHHQFDRNHEPCCALSLILKDMTIYNEAVRAFRWLKPTEKFDSKFVRGCKGCRSRVVCYIRLYILTDRGNNATFVWEIF